MKRVFRPTRSRGAMVLVAATALTLGLLVPLIGASAASANGVPFVKGDVLAGVGSSQVKNFSPTGTLQDTLTDSSGAEYTTGMCFDSEHNLYVTDFFKTMSKYNDHGEVLISPFPATFVFGHPESCTVDASNNIYAGGPETPTIEKLNTNGELIESIPVEAAGPRGGTDWVDLAANGCTMYYTSEGTEIDRYNVCTHVQEAKFASGLPAPCYALRIRPNGEVMVGCASEVVRLNAGGVAVQTYPIPGHLELFALNLDPDGTSFWTGDLDTGVIYHLDIETGAIINEFNSSPNTALAGLAVVGEIEVSRPEITLSPLTAENPVGATHTVTATVTEGGVPESGVTVTFTVTGANPQTGTGTTNEKGEATFTYKGEKAGTDTIVASFVDKTGKTDQSNRATKIWMEIHKEECTKAQGVGHAGPKGPEGLNEDNNLNTALIGKEQLETTLPHKEAHFRLTHLNTASCVAIAGGHEFSGQGKAALDGAKGYEESFSISVTEGKIYLSVVFEKEGTVLYTISHQLMNPKSKQTIS